MRPQLNVMRRSLKTAMRMTCALERVDGYTDPDPITLEQKPKVVRLWEGPCLLRPMAQVMRKAEAGAQTFTLSDYELLLPTDATPDGATQVVILHADGDPALTKAHFSVKGLELDDWGVARRLVVTLVQ